MSGTFALLENIAPAFSIFATYDVNDLCVYNNKLYRCTRAITTAGAWTGSTNWTEATVQDVVPLTTTTTLFNESGAVYAPVSTDGTWNIFVKSFPTGVDLSGLRVVETYHYGVYTYHLTNLPTGYISTVPEPTLIQRPYLRIRIAKESDYSDEIDLYCFRQLSIPRWVETESPHANEYALITSDAVARALPRASNLVPSMDDGTGSAGTLETYARADHVHPTDTTRASTAFVQSEKRYDLGTTVTISTASEDTSGGGTVYYGEATLLDRTVNQIAVTTAIDQLRITLPAATTGKVRDFAVRLEVGTGSASLAAPAIVVVSPDGETIVCENSTGVWPVAESGTASAKGITMLYFSETSASHFLFQARKLVAIS